MQEDFTINYEVAKFYSSYESGKSGRILIQGLAKRKGYALRVEDQVGYLNLSAVVSVLTYDRKVKKTWSID